MNSPVPFIRPSQRDEGTSVFMMGLGAVVVAGAVLLALDWFTQPAPDQHRAQRHASTPSKQAPIPSASGAAQTTAAMPDCAVMSPFASRGMRCKPATQILLDEQTQDDLLEADTMAQARELHVQSDMAIDVLRVRPGASLAAYKTAEQCDVGAMPAGTARDDCADLRKVMPFVLMDLEFNAVSQRDSHAAILMAQHHAGMLGRVAHSVRVYHLQQLQKYLGIVGGAFPEEVYALQRRIEEEQWENTTSTGFSH